MPRPPSDLPHRIPFVFVTSPDDGEVHLFVPDTFDCRYVYRVVAFNFSKIVRQPVKCYHDYNRQKYRIAPIGFDTLSNAEYLGEYCFTLDYAANVRSQGREPTLVDVSPKYTDVQPEQKAWILYRATKCHEVAIQYPEMTPAEISTTISNMWINEPPVLKTYWQTMAEEEDRKHTANYSGNHYALGIKKKPT
ncbi:hypothetical protein AK830_g7439 [Neonectria ditissima]|uniref:HMG box domain-containing protein n=1 Tax=Neonectria ditissima TaxID=78410 RepID=A0A0P7BA66_9HYPO|nr:hypothetical protein AK830_g7439 [Neonectria ditissima]